MPTLPSFKSVRVRRRGFQNEKTTEQSSQTASSTGLEDKSSEETPTPETQEKPNVDIKLATKTRRNAIIISAFSFLISTIFLILVSPPTRTRKKGLKKKHQTIIGNINTKPIIQTTWIFHLDLSNVYAEAFDSTNLVFVNSIARSLGLHDFYQVGLWNYCEGYRDEGITNCSPPQSLYWFNPVQILLSELLAGATIVLPAEINNILNLVRIASNLMFAFFVTGTVMNFVAVFVVVLAWYSRWWSLPLALFTFVAALLTTAAAVIATVMFTIFRNVVTSQPGLNIGAELGTQMLAFMWIGAGGSLLGFGIHLCLSCCCASRRDVRTGRKTGRRSAYTEASEMVKQAEGNGAGRRRWAGRKKTSSGDSLRPG
jgi:hypothetical protein